MTLMQSDELLVYTGGGGDPAARSTDLVDRDRANGLIIDRAVHHKILAADAAEWSTVRKRRIIRLFPGNYQVQFNRSLLATTSETIFSAATRQTRRDCSAMA